MNVIEKLWHSCFFENDFPHSSASEKILAEVVKHEGELLKLLDEKGRGIFEKLQKAWGDLYSGYELAAFEKGVKFAISLMARCLGGEDLLPE